MASDIEKELKEEEREVEAEKPEIEKKSAEKIEMQMEAPARSVRWDKIAEAGLLIIVVGALFLYIGYRYGKESAEQPATPVAIEATVVSSAAASSTATTDVTANWKIYTNDTYGFSFKYPAKFNAITKTTDEESSTKFLTLTDDPNTTTMPQEGCSGKYTLSVSDQNSPYDAQVSASSFDGIDNLKIDKSTLSGHRYAKISGIAGTMAYIQPGAGILDALIEIAPNSISFGVCNNGTEAVAQDQISEFDQMISTFKFSK